MLGGDDSLVRGVRVQEMELGAADASGRPRPVPIRGSEYEIELDSVIVAIGQGANPLLTQATRDLEVDARGRIVTEAVTQMTSIPGVFAGGDIVTGAATVILAMGANYQVRIHRIREQASQSGPRRGIPRPSTKFHDSGLLL